jgi:hypothetical protein
MLIAISRARVFAFGRVYGGAGWARAQGRGVRGAFIGVIRVYRLIVFFVTFYTAWEMTTLHMDHAERPQNPSCSRRSVCLIE